MAGFVTFFIARFFEIASLWFVSQGIDVVTAIIQHESHRFTIAEAAAGVIFSIIGRLVFVIHARRSVRRAGIAVAFDLRQKLYATVQQQGSEFFSRLPVGDIMTRAIQDISLVHRMITFGAFMFVIMVYAPFYAISFMLAKSVTLTLLILPLLPVIFFYAKRVAIELAVTSLALQERLSDLATHTEENLSGIRTVQALAQEQNEIRRFWQTNNRYSQAFYAQAKVNSRMMAWMPWFTQAGQLLIILYGGSMVLDGALTVGDLVFFLACLTMLLQPIRMAGMFITIVQRAAVATTRLYEIFDAEAEIRDAPSGNTPRLISGQFELRRLNYRYGGSHVAALTDINLVIQAGESIGIVGRVGSGKSTLLKLFTRMLNTNRGQLFLDGHDICDYPLTQLRTQISLVLQDSFLFSQALQNNISYDNPDRGMDVIWASADAAALKDTILALPDQMQTVVGERGVTLSGGQKQRTTLARGLIRHSPLLILDDCFSSVDTETEEHILERLKSMRSGKTTILVSHRISTLRHADRILVLDEGRVAEVGSHSELLNLGGLYAELERLQTIGNVSRPERKPL